jgi:hypothetical protein
MVLLAIGRKDLVRNIVMGEGKETGAGGLERLKVLVVASHTTPPVGIRGPPTSQLAPR